MFLAVDLGNSNCVFALYSYDAAAGYRQEAHWRMQTAARRTADEYAGLVAQWFASRQIAPGAVAGIAVCSVVPAACPHLAAGLQSVFNKTPAVVGVDGFAPDMEILLDAAHELGADRLINAWQAYCEYRSGLAVIDFGTATTFDIVNAKGQYCGGIIAPGIELSLQALCQAAAQLSMMDFQKPPGIIGRNTKTAMQSGFFYGTVGMIENMLERIRTEQGEIDHVIATGGLSVLIASETDAIDETRQDLTLKGLAALYHETHGSKKTA